MLFVLLVAYLLYVYRKLSPENRRKLVKLILAASLIGLLLLLVVTGRLNWLFAAIGALLPLVPRVIRMFLGYWPSLIPYFRRYQQNKQSSMQTRFIKLQIDMLNGQLQGEVLEGDFKASMLKDLSLEQLTQLLEECQREDAESAALLTAYMKRAHPDWTSKAGPYEYDKTASGMSEQEARNILGVSSTAGKKDIIKAHKHLMQKLHPDRGGSDYLAQQINQAKSTLMTLF